MGRRAYTHILTLLVVGATFAHLESTASAEKPSKKKKPAADADAAEEKAFRDRLATLTRDPANLIVIEMARTDDPSAIPGSASSTGLVLVAGNRQIETPDLLSPEDIRAVVNEHLADVKTCFKKQLAADPDWDDELILDLAIKKTGRVSEVSVAPRRVKKDPIGACLMSTVPKWKFPAFTGESDDGVTQEVVTASFPFHLTAK